MKFRKFIQYFSLFWKIPVLTCHVVADDTSTSGLQSGSCVCGKHAHWMGRKRRPERHRQHELSRPRHQPWPQVSRDCWCGCSHLSLDAQREGGFNTSAPFLCHPLPVLILLYPLQSLPSIYNLHPPSTISTLHLQSPPTISILHIQSPPTISALRLQTPHTIFALRLQYPLSIYKLHLQYPLSVYNLHLQSPLSVYNLYYPSTITSHSPSLGLILHFSLRSNMFIFHIQIKVFRLLVRTHWML